MSTAGQFHFVNGVVRGVDDGYNARILKAVRDVTIEEIKKVMKDVLMPAFTSGMSNVVVTCAPIMEEVRFPSLTSVIYIFSMSHSMEGDSMKCIMYNLRSRFGKSPCDPLVPPCWLRYFHLFTE